MSDLNSFDLYAMVEPKTSADRLLVLRELEAEVASLLAHFRALTKESCTTDVCAD